jgi:hypothetical protein
MCCFNIILFVQPLLLDEVAKIARVRNSVDVLRLVPNSLKHRLLLLEEIMFFSSYTFSSRMQILICPAGIISVYRKSESLQLAVKVYSRMTFGFLLP